MNKLIILATHNEHKAREIAEILDDTYTVKTMSDYGLTEDIVEDGETIAENAMIKVEALSKMLPESVKDEAILLADDTGLFVDYLGGAPGVYSARYAGENCTYSDNNKKLLKEMQGATDRKATFKTAMAAILPGNRKVSVISSVPGFISEEIRESDSGFGYDPVFIEATTNKTYSEMGDEEKNRLSHRKRALEGILENINLMQNASGGKKIPHHFFNKNANTDQNLLDAINEILRAHVDQGDNK